MQRACVNGRKPHEYCTQVQIHVRTACEYSQTLSKYLFTHVSGIEVTTAV
jgi:hypothetical protein